MYRAISFLSICLVCSLSAFEGASFSESFFSPEELENIFLNDYISNASIETACNQFFPLMSIHNTHVPAQSHTPYSPRGKKRLAPDSCNYLGTIENSPTAALIQKGDLLSAVKDEIVNKISYAIHTISHMRSQIRQYCDESQHPGICVSILNELRTRKVRSDEISYRETIATILKIHALRQGALLPIDSQFCEDKSQLNAIGLNTSEAASAEFFSNNDLIAEEFSLAIEHGMFHPSMIKQLNHRYMITQFKQCLQSTKKTIKSFEARKKLIEYHAQNHQEPAQETKTENEHEILKMFGSWKKEMPNLPKISVSRAATPQTITQQPSENNSQLFYTYAPTSQQWATEAVPHYCCYNPPAYVSSENSISDIVNNIVALAAMYTPEELRMRLVTDVSNYISKAPEYRHFLSTVLNIGEACIAPMYVTYDQQYFAESPPQMHSIVSTDEYVDHTSPISTQMGHFDMASNPPASDINTLHHKNFLTPYGEELADLLKTNPNNIGATRRYINLAETDEQCIDIIKALQSNSQTTEVHLTLAKLGILRKGKNLSAIPESPNQISPHEDSGSQRTSIALNTSPEASRKFFCEKDAFIKQLKDGVKLGMFHESMVFELAKKSKSIDSFNKFMHVLTQTMSQEQFDSLCNYYNQYKETIEFDATNKHQKNISTRFHNFHTTSYAELKSAIKKKQNHNDEKKRDRPFIHQSRIKLAPKYTITPCE